MENISQSVDQSQEKIEASPVPPVEISPQDVLTALEHQNITPEDALNCLTELGIFRGLALSETLFTLLDGIRAQDTMFALARFPRPFRNRIVYRVRELMDGTETSAPVVAREDGELLIYFFEGAEAVE